MYIGHKAEDGRVQALIDHLLETAELAEFFAPDWAKAHAYRIAALHDVGKTKSAVQRRLSDPATYTQKVDHSTAGAKALRAMGDAAGMFVAAGHHSGLMDMGSQASTASDGTLMGRMKAADEGADEAFIQSLELPKDALAPAWTVPGQPHTGYAMSLYIRMLFSCLVDADFINTETFMQGAPLPRGGGDSIEALLAKLKTYTQKWFPPKRAIDEKRCEILSRCMQGGEDARGLYTLSVPTGGGKTVASLAFALAHAQAHGLHRVIYVVPYTSIIEQNAQVFRDILGDDNVLEHHHNVDYEDADRSGKNGQHVDDDDADRRRLRMRLATENWDAPVIVTTAVQFFESLYAAKTSRCRKLHHIAQSVVIFDEAQMMPLSYLRPCVASIAELVRHYGVTAVLCTATQPALGKLFAEFAPELAITELCPHMQEMYEFFRRVRYVHEGKLTEGELALRLAQETSVLCVVGTRARARAVFDALPEEGRYHLSTLMTPQDRSKTIEEIRERLANGQCCRVVSTSLIEAGVDVDFPSVWREEAGLDSILQAAGRCNREGKRDREESIVHVYAAQDGAIQPLQKQIEVMRIVSDMGMDTDAPETIHTYFEGLLKLKENVTDKKNILSLCERLSFRTVAENFKLIESNTRTIYIQTPENAELIRALKEGAYSKGLMRKLARDAVNVYEAQFLQLAGANKLTLLDGCAVLEDASAYDAVRGLTTEGEPGVGLFV